MKQQTAFQSHQGVIECELGVSKAVIADVQYSESTDFDTHRHEEAYLGLVTSGSYEEWSGARHQTLRRGAGCFYPQGSHHAVRTGNAVLKVLYVTDPSGAGWAGQFARPWLGLLWMIHREVASFGDDGPDDAATLHLESLVCELRPSAEPRRRPPWLRFSLATIRENSRRRVHLHDLACSASVHPSHFARTFRRSCGMTAGEYVSRLRVVDAIEILRRDDRGLAAVAFDAGFADQSHMGRYFRRYLGATPGAVRGQLLRRN